MSGNKKHITYLRIGGVYTSCASEIIKSLAESKTLSIIWFPDD
jgi:hypothetical protein